jgi:hypothetical protein
LAPARIARDADWTAVVQTALRHGVAGLLCRSLCRLSPEEVPSDIVDAASVHLANADTQGTALVTQLFEILDVLAADGVPALPFKGPVLGMLAHASATIRPSRDIDVLIHREDMGRAIAALRRLNYRLGESFPPRIMAAYWERYGQIILFADARTPVEPHWTFSPASLAVDLDMQGIWDRARPVDLAGRSVLALSPEDTLLTACLHGSKEKWWRLLWVADVAAFIQRHPALDWNALMERARIAGVLRMFLLGPALAQDLFSSPLPLVVSNAIKGDAACQRLVEESRTYLFDPSADVGSVNRVSRYHLNSRERSADRVRYVWRTMTMPGVDHYGMIKLPDSLFAGYVAIKLIHDYVLLPIWKVGKGRWWRRTRNSIPDVAA